jgi:hypothetical protein
MNIPIGLLRCVVAERTVSWKTRESPRQDRERLVQDSAPHQEAAE